MLASVIGREATQFERVITLDRGSDAGLELGDAVLSDGGALVGSVVEVGPTYSFVRLINDSRSLVAGRDSKTRATGMISGRLAAPLEMTDIRITDAIEVGHAVVTAGINQGRRFQSLFPPGLVVGQIIDVRQDPRSVVQTAFVEPAADLDHLESVLVITDYEGARPPSALAGGRVVGMRARRRARRCRERGGPGPDLRGGGPWTFSAWSVRAVVRTLRSTLNRWTAREPRRGPADACPR